MAEGAADSDDTARLRRLLPTCRCPRRTAGAWADHRTDPRQWWPSPWKLYLPRPW